MGISIPASSAASTIPVPGGTWICRSSIVTVTSPGAFKGTLRFSLGEPPGSPRPPPPVRFADERLRCPSSAHLHVVLIHRREDSLQRGLAAVRALALVDVAL